MHKWLEEKVHTQQKNKTSSFFVWVYRNRRRDTAGSMAPESQQVSANVTKEEETGSHMLLHFSEEEYWLTVHERLVWVSKSVVFICQHLSSWLCQGTQCDMVSPNKLPSTYTPYIPWGETSVFSPTILFHTAKNLQPPTLESEMTGTVKISLAVLWSNVRLDPGLFLKGVTWRNKNKISTIPCVRHCFQLCKKEHL